MLACSKPAPKVQAPASRSPCKNRSCQTQVVAVVMEGMVKVPGGLFRFGCDDELDGLVLRRNASRLVQVHGFRSIKLK